MRMDRRPVRRLKPDPAAPRPPDGEWPVTVPAVAQLLREGLELPAGATVLVGENGSGKSTVFEVVAAALGFTPRAAHATPVWSPGPASRVRST